MILDMAWDKEKCYLFTGGVDMKCRSWMAEIGSEAKVFEGATRSVSCLLVRGNICKCSWCKETDSSFPFLIFSLFIIFKDLSKVLRITACLKYLIIAKLQTAF